MTAVISQKRELRRSMRTGRLAHWQALPESHRALVFGRPPRMILPLIERAETIGLYHAVPGEVPTDRYAAHMLDMGKMIALPWTRSHEGPMTFRLWTGSEATLERGPWGIQPHAAMPEVIPDALFMPLVAFDSALNRLGQGGAHYDGWCAAHPRTRRIGLAWTVQQADHVPAEPHDMPLDAVITEQQVLLPQNERMLP
ncbi:5-formyltetrahydrofolate cyclo-ligase [Blastomonas sp.]|uniref:5-formyltetrahydrofolate cyclo-ligase n=1 Tax=Blastomonas sp. TaxID=1909299 RepID=UPI00262D534D|nr:5-formyltetrahydrofolate cyclo-ligase [Blastomonas sp.]MDM7954871.1 5-formyltetrahydrofolate cyclo-ligase [Blastomonas sp.]